MKRLGPQRRDSAQLRPTAVNDLTILVYSFVAVEGPCKKIGVRGRHIGYSKAGQEKLIR